VQVVDLAKQLFLARVMAKNVVFFLDVSHNHITSVPNRSACLNQSSLAERAISKDIFILRHCFAMQVCTSM
jgi:hypothetical protein